MSYSIQMIMQLSILLLSELFLRARHMLSTVLTQTTRSASHAGDVFHPSVLLRLPEDKGNVPISLVFLVIPRTKLGPQEPQEFSLCPVESEGPRPVLGG